MENDIKEIVKEKVDEKTVQKTRVVSKPELVADDERGIIEKQVEGEFNSVLRITSKAGAVRANHYHQHDSHVCYLVSGKVRYVERPASDDAAPLVEYIIEPGQLFYSAPMMAHAMEFLEDSEFLAYTKLSRKQDAYEEDTIRVILIDPEEAAARAAK